jgi:hypothetical protein
MEEGRNQLVLQLVTREYRGVLICDGNQVRSEVLGTLRADLYTGDSVSKYSIGE